MPPSHYTRITLAERPKAEINSSTFRTEVVPFDLKPGDGQVLVRVEHISLDPAMRGWLNDRKSYIRPVQIGEVMRALAVGVVVEAGAGSAFAPGDSVSGTLGWTDYAVVDDKDVQKLHIPKGGQLLDYLGPLGLIGMTAYVGLVDVGKVKSGEKLLVSGAAGATGSLVCQLGKKMGAQVYAIAGSDEKCAWLESELGVDKALNYKSPTFHDDFKKHVSSFDLYFDNVGGDLLNFALTRMNVHARIVLCGAISAYNDPNPKGITAYQTLITQRGKLEGFIVFDYAHRYPAIGQEMAKWIADGSLKRKFHVVEGLEKAPEALPMLYNGGNTGKLVIKVVHPADAKL
ncbi:alcohol dehydrogenase [Amylocystis lapponica]|nr:alcohol dehydrogenase [Amylocystis lapponica]